MKIAQPVQLRALRDHLLWKYECIHGDKDSLLSARVASERLSEISNLQASKPPISAPTSFWPLISNGERRR
jgi:hypothetical protein